MATVEFKLKEPRWPNFILVEMPPRRREEGFNADGPKIPVGDLNEEQQEWLLDSLRSHLGMPIVKAAARAGKEGE